MNTKTITELGAFIQSNPNATVELMTQDGYFLLTPQLGRRLLEGGSIKAHLGTSDTWHTVEAENLLEQQILEVQRDRSDPDKFYIMADWPRQEIASPEMNM